MARNKTTKDMGDVMTASFISSKSSVDDFITTQVSAGAFDICRTPDNTTFHKVCDSSVYTYYYHKSDNRWYCKE